MFTILNAIMFVHQNIEAIGRSPREQSTPWAPALYVTTCGCGQVYTTIGQPLWSLLLLCCCCCCCCCNSTTTPACVCNRSQHLHFSGSRFLLIRFRLCHAIDATRCDMHNATCTNACSLESHKFNQNVSRIAYPSIFILYYTYTRLLWRRGNATVARHPITLLIVS